ncbi:unnamed protein product, partial [Didymodactylos carnosus]
LFESRKAFHNRFEIFERSVRDIAEQIESNGQIQTASYTTTLRRLQQIQKQLHTIQSVLTTIGHELDDLEVAGITRIELQTIRNTYDSHQQRLQTYNDILQKRIDLLKRFEEHSKRSDDIRTKLNHINDELNSNQTIKM